MPITKKQDGTKVKAVSVKKVFIEIPVKSNTALNIETYLVPSRVADYIEKLEKRIVGELPKLSKKR